MEEGNGRQRKAAEGSGSIARNCGHFAPVINCQRHLILKMAEKSQRSGGRISYDVLDNLSSVDLIYDDKRKKKTSQKNLRHFSFGESKAILCGFVFNFPAYLLLLKSSLVC